MEPNHKKYFSKLLLFGEYTIGIGGSALALPNQKFYGQWVQDTVNNQKAGLIKLLEHIKSIKALGLLIDTSAFASDISNGWYFESNIPHGYGLGSSGAVVAAVMDKYCHNPSNKNLNTEQLLTLKTNLAAIECAFHGVSSGIDPLVSYLNQGVHIIDKGNLELINKKIDLSHFFLIDSNISRSTTPLVSAYNRAYHEDQEFHDAQNLIKNLNQLAIEELISGNINQVWQSFKKISELQYHSYINTPGCNQIIDYIEPIWSAGLEDTNYAIKLCGAGGGGVYLGMSLDVKDFISKNPELLIHRLA